MKIRSKLEKSKEHILGGNLRKGKEEEDLRVSRRRIRKRRRNPNKIKNIRKRTPKKARRVKMMTKRRKSDYLCILIRFL